MKMAAERRPIDTTAQTTDVKLKPSSAGLGMGMANRFPKEYSVVPRKGNHSLAVEGKKKGGA